MPCRFCPRDATRLGAPANTRPALVRQTPCKRATVLIASRRSQTCGRFATHRGVLARHRCTDDGTRPALPSTTRVACGWATADTYTFFCFSTYCLMTANGAPPTVLTK